MSNPEESTPEESTQMTEAVGQVIGEVLVILSQVVGALRKQPGFDSASFDAELRGIVQEPTVSMLQKHALEMLLEQKAE